MVIIKDLKIYKYIFLNKCSLLNILDVAVKLIFFDAFEMANKFAFVQPIIVFKNNHFTFFRLFDPKNFHYFNNTC